MKAVTDILDSCVLSIKNACKPPSNINTTTLDTCKANAIAFNKTVSSCILIATRGKDACSCFQDAEVLKEKKVLEKCKGSRIIYLHISNLSCQEQVKLNQRRDKEMNA